MEKFVDYFNCSFSPCRECLYQPHGSVNQPEEVFVSSAGWHLSELHLPGFPGVGSMPLYQLDWLRPTGCYMCRWGKRRLFVEPSGRVLYLGMF